jgi:hypothetical protein
VIQAEPTRPARFGIGVDRQWNDRRFDVARHAPTNLDRLNAQLHAAQFSKCLDQGRLIVILDPVAHELVARREVQPTTVEAVELNGREPLL